MQDEAERSNELTTIEINWKLQLTHNKVKRRLQNQIQLVTELWKKEQAAVKSEAINSPSRALKHLLETQ